MKPGDYVLATKYTDGDSGDHFAVGYLSHMYDHYGQLRYVVVDNDGRPFRANGFRRCEKITREQGIWLVAHFPEMEARPLRIIECGTTSRVVGKSVWDWLSEAKCKTLSSS